MSQHWMNLQLSWINVILCSFSADKLDLLLIATRPVVENIHLSTKISRPIELSRNSAAETFYGGFTASKIRRLIRRAVIFPADFRRTNIRQRIRRSAAAEGSSLMSHWPCVTDFSGLSTYRLTAQTGRWAPCLYALLLSMAHLPLNY